jgi:hypothetical protein
MHHHRERGLVLFPVVVILFIGAALSAALYTTVQVETKISTLTRQKSVARGIAEGAVETLKKQILTARVEHRPLPTTGTITIGHGTATYSVTTAGTERNTVDGDGIVTLVQPYLIQATTDERGVIQTVNQIVDVGLTPIFQFAIFYHPDLEFLPGPNMTLSGRIHSNRDIYIGTHNALTVNANYLRCPGSIFRVRKDSNDAMLGTVNVRVKDSTAYGRIDSTQQLAALGIPSIWQGRQVYLSGFDSTFAGYDINGDGDFADPSEWSPWTVESLERWNGTVQTGVHGVGEKVAPPIGSIKRFEPYQGGDYNYNPSSGQYEPANPPGTGTHRKGYYYSMADISIIGTTAYRHDGTAITLPAGTITTATMYDGRENRNVTVTEVDIEKLNTVMSTYVQNTTEGFLLYAARTDATTTQPNGIRLKNGSTLGMKLTVASEDPVYVWGNYNSTAKKGASVISDAVNLLSNSWNNSKTANTLPGASNTTYNFAMISGNSNSTWGNYNGGLENLPRFHENWDGRTATIRGSFVNLFLSELARGAWVYGGDNYTAPVRNWDYDTDFNNSANLPPYTPYVAYVQSVAYYQP